MKINTSQPVFTHEGARATKINSELELRRAVLASLLWESQFYESGVDIAERIKDLVPKVKPEKVANLAKEARSKHNLRHVPLLLVREMARYDSHKSLVAETLSYIIQRPDELTEFLAIYWMEGRQPLSAQVKKGLADAFRKFNAYQLSKYDRPGRVRLRDVLFLSHAKPKDEEQARMWKQLIDGTLPVPETWETMLSAGQDKKETFEKLLDENKLGGLAFLRNLRNMIQAGVDEEKIKAYFKDASHFRQILPFRFIAAARYAPRFEPYMEETMLAALKDQEKLPGKTILLTDISGSMEDFLSGHSEMMQMDAAAALAILAREVCEDVQVFTFSDDTVEVPPRRGFALRDAIIASQEHSWTRLGEAVRKINEQSYDRLIVFTDEQTGDPVPNPKGRAYMVNVASYRNGVGYGSWTHIDGFSAHLIDWIREYESLGNSSI